MNTRAQGGVEKYTQSHIYNQIGVHDVHTRKYLYNEKKEMALKAHIAVANN